MSRLALYLLGSPRLELGGEEILIKRRKAMALLAYLAVTGRSHRREALATLLWSESDSSHARANLRRALSVLYRVLGDNGIIADRETAELNPDLGLWLDVDAFQHKLAACELHDHPANEVCVECVPLLEQAVVLYRDDFFAGFTLDDSTAFDEWLFFQTEGLRNALGSTLERLVRWYSNQDEGTFETAITYARRWLALDSLHESAHRQLMSLYAQSGQRSAALRQYRECVRVLEVELGVAPTEETTALYEIVRSTRGAETGHRSTQISTDNEITVRNVEDDKVVRRLPAFLDEDATPIITEEPVFVAREKELARLDGYLDAALAGQGQIAFVTGGPGRGKTSLMRTFARQVMEKHPDLLVVQGNCTAYAGVGDPYLSFREVLTMLTGDVESRWAAGTISRDHAKRVWSALPQTLPALVQHGPSLIGFLAPGSGLLSRASLVASTSAGWLQELQASIELPGTSGLEQNAIFQQVTNLLGAISAKHPLLLILDDLQWADAGSIGLLFHLGRRLTGHRIMILGAYRPEEVAAGRNGKQHPLENVLDEFKQQFGDVWIDLRKAGEAQGDRFVNALVDTETNHLGEKFREALVARTGGHPLFTVELLREMQARGELVRDVDGAWIEGSELNWELLPVRVDAVIGKRLGRLSAEQRDLLAVASVEGETFTAQVVAQVLGLEEWVVLRTISQNLTSRHRLVREREEVRADGQFLSRYQFSHALFQNYLYRELSGGERRLLHGEVAMAMQGAYGEQTDRIAAHLAHHYHQAGHREKAIGYTLQAGEQARGKYALEEAIAYFNRALALCEATVDPSVYDRQRYEVLVWLGRSYKDIGNEAEGEALLRAAMLLEDKVTTSTSEKIWLRYWLVSALKPLWRHEEMMQLAEENRALLDDNTPALETVMADFCVFYAAVCVGNAQQVEESLTQITARLPNVAYTPTMLEVYHEIADYYMVHQETATALQWGKRLEDNARACHDLRGQALAYFRHGLVFFFQGRIKEALPYLDESVLLSERAGNMKLAAVATFWTSKSHNMLANPLQAEVYARKAAAYAEPLKHKLLLSLAFQALCIALLNQGKLIEAVAVIEDAVQLCNELGNPDLAINFLGITAHINASMGDLGSAEELLDRSFSLWTKEQGWNAIPEGVFEALCNLEPAYNDAAAYRAFCKRLRTEYPKLERTVFQQWYIEPAEPRIPPPESRLIAVDTPLSDEWSWVDPLGDCRYTLDPKDRDSVGSETPSACVGWSASHHSLANNLVIHAVHGRDLYESNRSAPRLVHKVSANLILEAVCESFADEFGVCKPFMGGLLLWKDPGNFLRVEVGVIHENNLYFSGWLEGEDLIAIGRGMLPTRNPDRVILRMERVGDEVRALCSADGQAWFTLGEISFPVEDPVDVGVHVIDRFGRFFRMQGLYSLHPEGSAIRFSDVKLWTY